MIINKNGFVNNITQTCNQKMDATIIIILCIAIGFAGFWLLRLTNRVTARANQNTAKVTAAPSSQVTM